MPDSRETLLAVREMSCNHCVEHVTQALTALPGVSHVDVSLDAGTARVRHDPGAVTVDELAAASTAAGYPAAPAA